MEDFAKKKGFDSLVPRNWYTVTRHDILTNIEVCLSQSSIHSSFSSLRLFNIYTRVEQLCWATMAATSLRQLLAYFLRLDW